MKLNNKYNLPETIYKALKADHHFSAGDISVSQLIDAPQIRVLRKLHRDELEEDISDKVAALIGTSVHSILERANYKNHLQKSFDDVRNHFIDIKNKAENEEQSKLAHENILIIDEASKKAFPDSIDNKYVCEKTLHITVDDMVISGTPDLLDLETSTLQDYKTCSTYAYLFPDSKLSWIRQINIYALMLRENGYNVDNASVVAIFKDFSKSKIIQNKDYPKQPIIEIPIELYPPEKVMAYIKERVRLHKQAESGNVIECTGSDRWAKADMYAVMVKGAKRALRVVETKISAEKFIELNKESYEGLTIEYRPGENKRCAEYCSVSQFCKQNLSYLNKK